MRPRVRRDKDRRYPEAVFRRLCSSAVLAVLSLTIGCASSIQNRPYRFDLPAHVPQTTQLIAQRMSGDHELRPTLVDPAAGTILAPWRMTGVAASLRLWPPGEDRAWLLERYRVFVRPVGWQSMVLVDLERLECSTRGFRWDPLNVWGNCKPTRNPSGTQARIDAKAQQIANARP
jgi:hypothetical protein